MTPRLPVNMPRSDGMDLAERVDAVLQRHGCSFRPNPPHDSDARSQLSCQEAWRLRVLVIENFDNTGLGQVGAALEEAGAEIDLRRAHQGDPLPDNGDGHDAIVVLGGGQNALADEACPWFPDCWTWSGSSSGRTAPCSASAWAASSSPAPSTPRTRSAAQRIRLASCRADRERESGCRARRCPQSFPIFQWHDDTFSLPERAVRLAGSDCRESGLPHRPRDLRHPVPFRGRPSARAAMEPGFRDYIGKWYPDWPPRFENEAARHGPDADAAGLAIARAWVKTI